MDSSSKRIKMDPFSHHYPESNLELHLQMIECLKKSSRDQLLCLMTSFSTEDLRNQIIPVLQKLNRAQQSHVLHLLKWENGISTEIFRSKQVLPQDIFFNVFQYLDARSKLTQIVKVCRSWCALVMDSKSWFKVSMNQFAAKLLDEHISSTVLFWKRIIELDLTDCVGVIDNSVKMISTHCTKLRLLNLRNCYSITDSSLNSISNLHYLCWLCLSSCVNISDKGIFDITKDGCCNQLEAILLQNCSGLTNLTCYYISKGLPELQGLRLEGCILITDEGIRQLAEGIPLLSVLDIDRVNITDRAAQSMQKWHQLHVLDLNECINLTDTALELISQGCSNVKTLGLRSCTNISANGIYALAKGMRFLNSLDLSECININDLCISYLGYGCLDLRDLFLIECRKITDEALHFLSRCSKLRTLYLDECVGITDKGINEISQSCLNISTLGLQGCVKITNQSMTSLSKSLHSLSELNLSRTHISDEGITILFQGCPIKHLYLCDCIDIHDTTLMILADYGKLLLLDIQGSINLTPEGISLFSGSNILVTSTSHY